jgi:hypothetical protein
MFKLVVALFMVIHGEPSHKPSAVIEITPTFATREECVGFLKSDDGKKSKESIQKLANEIDGDVAIKTMCVKSSKEEADDGKI